MSFPTEIDVGADGTLTGPFRSPAQMLADQEYGGHASVHDDAEAAKLGLAGAPIEGPTHFSQFDALAVEHWGRAWFERGCISSHFLNMVVEGEQVQASLTPHGEHSATINAMKHDGTPVLTGTASIGTATSTELDVRRERGLGDPGDLYIVDQLEIGMTADPTTAMSSFYARRCSVIPRIRGACCDGGGWPLDDIQGWLDNIVDGVVVSGPEEAEVGGLPAVSFEVEVADAAVCGVDYEGEGVSGPPFCIGFVVNTVDSNGDIEGYSFEPGFNARVFWIDQGDLAPIVILVGTRSDEGAFGAAADALLATVSFGDPQPHPIDDPAGL